MEIRLNFEAQQDLEYWKKANNEKVLKRIRQLLSAIQENPFQGIGKPEPLKHELSGKWSRRINHEHRIIYQVQQNSIIEIYSLRGHY